MANPAGTLLEIFGRWNQPGQVLIAVRQPNSDETVRDHLVAMRCLWQIERELDFLDRVGRRTRSWRNALPRWVAAVIAYPIGWRDNAGDQLYDEATVLDPLDSLADVLETRSMVDPPTTKGVDQLLADALELLRADPTLEPNLRAYIGRLLDECRRALEDVELFGQFDLDDALLRLWVAVGAAADRTTDDSMRSRWRRFRDEATPAFVAALLANAPAWVDLGSRALGS